MNSEPRRNRGIRLTSKDRWLVALALSALIAAVIGLLTGHPGNTPAVPPDQEISQPLLQPPQLPDTRIVVEDLKEIEVPVVGLEAELEQKMNAMFVKPEDALKSVEAPKPNLPPEP